MLHPKNADGTMSMKASYLLQLFTLEKTAAKLAAISKTLVTTFEQQINSGAQKVYCGNVN